MGLFSKIKKMFSSKDEETLEIDEEEIEQTDEDGFEVDEDNESIEESEDEEELEEIEESEDEEELEKVEETEDEEKPEEEEKLTKKELKQKKKEEKLLLKQKKKEEKRQKQLEEVRIYEKGLTKSREGFVSKLAFLTNKYKKITDDYFDELEETLIMADIGVNTVMNFMDRLRDRVKHEKIENTEDLKEIIIDELFIIYVNDEVLVNKINFNDNGPTVVLFVGVNGVGKTTTIAKIASKMKKEGKKVLLVGGDTFRAGAVLQLEDWGKKIGVDFFGKEQGADPASVVFDGLVKAKEENYDLVLVDTAGRLQNKVNLMKELEKINRVIGQQVEGGPHETLLVIDATTGQNGISQAKSFKEITSITGIVLTKLDGTAKGGIVLAIKDEVSIPVKYIGLGEREEDLQVFDIEKYIYGLFKDL
ncbi:MAG: signal recognition particle-docking protein FtsY [Bacilli bacterium]|nr:signal recognition particle-docking protein FtsY [Bacilli bacterium]